MNTPPSRQRGFGGFNGLVGGALVIIGIAFAAGVVLALWLGVGPLR